MKKLLLLLLMAVIAVAFASAYPYFNDTSDSVWIPVNLSAGENLTVYLSDVGGYAPNGSQVFDLFDDFDGTALSALWNPTDGSYYSVADGLLNMTSPSDSTIEQIDSVAQFSQGYGVLIRAMDDANPFNRAGIGFATPNYPIGYGESVALIGDYLYYCDNTVNNFYPSNTTSDVFHIFDVDRIGATSNRFYQDYGLLLNGDLSDSLLNESDTVQFFDKSGTGSVLVDWIGVHKVLPSSVSPINNSIPVSYSFAQIYGDEWAGEKFIVNRDSNSIVIVKDVNDVTTVCKLMDENKTDLAFGTFSGNLCTITYPVVAGNYYYGADSPNAGHALYGIYWSPTGIVYPYNDDGLNFTAGYYSASGTDVPDAVYSIEAILTDNPAPLAPTVSCAGNVCHIHSDVALTNYQVRLMTSGLSGNLSISNVAPNVTSSLLLNGLIDYWNMSSIADVFGIFPITTNNVVASSGIIGDAFNLSTANSFLNLGNITHTDNVTINYWVYYADNVSDGNNLETFDRRQGLAPSWFTYAYFRQSSTAYLLKEGGTTSSTPDYADTFGINTPQWNHARHWDMYSFVKNGSSTSFWRDGILLSDHPDSSPIWYGGDFNLFFGQGDDLSRMSDNMVIDEVGMWDRGLNQSEILELYNSGAGLAYPFNLNILPSYVYHHNIYTPFDDSTPNTFENSEWGFQIVANNDRNITEVYLHNNTYANSGDLELRIHDENGTILLSTTNITGNPNIVGLKYFNLSTTPIEIHKGLNYYVGIYSGDMQITYIGSGTFPIAQQDLNYTYGYAVNWNNPTLQARTIQDIVTQEQVFLSNVSLGDNFEKFFFENQTGDSVVQGFFGNGFIDVTPTMEFVAGKHNQSINITDGNYGNISLDYPNSTVGTVAFWIYPKSYSCLLNTGVSDCVILGKFNSSSDSDWWDIELTNNAYSAGFGSIGITHGNLGTQLYTAGTVPLNQWSNVVVRNNGSGLAIFLNGVNQNLLDAGGVVTFRNSWFDAGDELLLGTFDRPSTTKPNTQADVLLDDLFFYNYALSDEEIENLSGDISAPIVQFVSPSDSGYINRSFIQANVSAVDNFDVFNVSVSLYDENLTFLASNVSTNSFYSVFSGLSDGTYYMNASACDTSNNCASTNTTIIITDTIFPVVIIESPTPVNGSIISNEAFWNFSISDLNLLQSSLNIFYGGVLQDDVVGTTSLLAHESGMLDGLWTYNVSVSDLAGNVYSSPMYSFTVDTTPPSIKFVSPTDSGYVNRNFILANVSLSEPHLASYALNLYNDSALIATNIVPSIVNFSGLSDGTYYLNASATDVLNNSNRTATNTIIIDTVNPFVQFVSPTDVSGNISNRSYIFYNVSASDIHLSNLTVFLYNDENNLVYSIEHNALADDVFPVTIGLYGAGVSYTTGIGGRFHSKINGILKNVTFYSAIGTSLYLMDAGCSINLSNTTIGSDYVGIFNYPISANTDYCVKIQEDIFVNSGDATMPIIGDNIDFLSNSLGSTARMYGIQAINTEVTSLSLDGNFSGLPVDNYTMYAVAYDSAGNFNFTDNRSIQIVNSTFSHFVPPEIRFITPPTEVNNSVVDGRNYIDVEVFANDTFFVGSTIYIFDGGRNLIFNRTVSSNINQVRFSVPKSDIYYINASSTDAFSNTNVTETRVVSYINVGLVYGGGGTTGAGGGGGGSPDNPANPNCIDGYTWNGVACVAVASLSNPNAIVSVQNYQPVVNLESNPVMAFNVTYSIGNDLAVATQHTAQITDSNGTVLQTVELTVLDKGLYAFSNDFSNYSRNDYKVNLLMDGQSNEITARVTAYPTILELVYDNGELNIVKVLIAILVVSFVTFLSIFGIISLFGAGK